MRRSWRWCAVVDGDIVYSQSPATKGKVVDETSITENKAAAAKSSGQAVRVLVIR